MSRVVLEGFRFFYEDTMRGRVLLADTGDYAANESKALLHYIDDDYVWVMRDNLKNITEYIERDNAGGASIRAAIGVSKMLPIFHDENRIYAVSADLPDNLETNVVPIRAACNCLPLPENYYDVVVVDSVDVTQERVAQMFLSLRVGGLFLLLLPAGAELSCAIPASDSFSDDDGNSLLRVRMTRELAAIFEEGTEKGRLERQKRLISYILDELGDSLSSILASGDEMRLEAAITQAALAEDNILPIYEELVSEDIKYLANRFKESLIEFRLHPSEKVRNCVLEAYMALRREMRECDAF